MDKNLELMITLQAKDDEIARIDDLLEKLPTLIDQHATALNKAKDDYAEFTKKLDELKKERQQKEKDVQDKEEAIKKTNGKLHEIKTNQEYTAAIAEMDNHKKAIEALEEEQLELMDKVDQSSDEDNRLKKAVALEEKAFNAIKSEKETEIESIKKDKEILVADRTSIHSEIEEKIAKQYDQLASTRAGKGLSKMTDGFCTECHTTVRPQMAVEISVGNTIHNCPSCQRILYAEKSEIQEAK